jgi:voltage-gated potassium channel Kch
MTLVAALGGILIILTVLVEAFEVLVLPRQVTRPYRPTRFYYIHFWRLWRASACLFPARRRQAVLSIFGPLSLLGLFALWAAALMVGFGLLHLAAGFPSGLAEALYFSGVTFTTLGYGDVTPSGPADRLLAVLEAGLGFGYFAVVIGYLPVLYQAFSRREAFISSLDARAGSPPAAGRLLLRSPPGNGDGVLLRFLEEGERWSAELLESHLSFPVLGFYRSQHDNQSWLAALTCLLDSSALLLTVADGPHRAQARLTFAMARHALVDLSLVLRRKPLEPPVERLPEARLRELSSALRADGVAVRDDAGALSALANLRSLYEPFVAGMAEHFRFPVPTVWPEEERPDNWQTSAWMRRAAPLKALGVNPDDDHFD